MATIIGNGTITFGDGTVRTSGIFNWSGGLTGVPTQLSQFTNDLGNYGGFLVAANATSGNSFTDPSNIASACGSTRGSVGHLTSSSWGLTWTGTVVGLRIFNCNCACNC